MMADSTRQPHITTVLLVLYSISLVTCFSNAEEFTKEILVPDNVDLHMTDVEIRADRGFIYATCNRNSSEITSLPSRSPSEYDCTLHVVTPQAGENQCHVTFKAEGSRGIREIEMEPFGQNRVLFIVLELDEDKAIRVRINTVDLKDCKMHRFNYPDALGFPRRYYVGLTIYPNKYELMLRDNNICGGFNQCKITYDPEGRQVAGPVAIPNEYLYMSQITAPPGSLDGGFFTHGQLNLDEKWWRTIYVDANGTEQVLATMEGEAGFEMFSNNRDLYAYCGTTDSDTEMDQFWCLQYDWKTGQKVNFTFDEFHEERNRNTSYFTVAFANLGMGKFLFTTVECKEEDTLCEKIHLSTVDGSGQVVKSSAIPMNMTCPTPYVRRSDVSETSESFCFNFMCSNSMSYESTNRYIKFHGTCISKNQIE